MCMRRRVCSGGMEETEQARPVGAQTGRGMWLETRLRGLQSDAQQRPGERALKNALRASARPRHPPRPSSQHLHMRLPFNPPSNGPMTLPVQGLPVSTYSSTDTDGLVQAASRVQQCAY